MLTATYTLVSLSVEQANIRVGLSAFRKYVQSTLMCQQKLTLAQLEYACESLHRLYQACHWRKIEMYLIPAIREATRQADSLLDELARLNQAALSAVRSLQEQVGQAGEHSERPAGEICAGIEQFCDALMDRLDKEEKELFTLARSVIGGETWFAIANQFLLHDAHAAEVRRGRAALPMPLVQPIPAGAAGHVKALAKPIDFPEKTVQPTRFLPELLGQHRTRAVSRAVAE